MSSRLVPFLALTGLVGGLAADEVVVPDTGHTAWILTASALVLFMTLPGLALFYGGLVRHKNVLSILVQCLGLAAVMSVVWFICGYSLAFGHGGESANFLIGGLDDFFLWGMTTEDTKLGLPKPIFVLFQMTFFIITPALIIGGVAERMKFSAILLFSVFWGLLCYLPICHQVWGGGWMGEWGVKDLAGGTVVHVTAGIAALVACLVVGKRRGYPEEPIKPHNLTMTVTGTGMLWVGWFGFNGGSVLAADGGASMAILVTHISACAAVLTWMAIEWLRHGKPSALGMATGAIAGLATITPASGNVGPFGAFIIGICAGIGCYWGAVWLKNKMGWDESLDAFGVHGVGGAIGTVLVAVFAHPALGGYGIEDYALGDQLIKQVVAVVVTAIWSGGVALILLYAIKALIGLRVTDDAEDLGMDLSEHDERGYILF